MENQSKEENKEKNSFEFQLDPILFQKWLKIVSKQERIFLIENDNKEIILYITEAQKVVSKWEEHKE